MILCIYNIIVRLWQNSPFGEQSADIEGPHDLMSLHLLLDPNLSLVTLVEPQELQQIQITSNINSNMPMMPQPPPILPVSYGRLPYSFAVHPIHTLPPPPVGLYLPTPQYQNTQPGPMPQQYFIQGNSQPPLRPVAYPITTVQRVVPNQNQIKIVQPPNVTVTSAVNVGVPQPGPASVPVPVNQPVPPIVPGRHPPPQV